MQTNNKKKIKPTKQALVNDSGNQKAVLIAIPPKNAPLTSIKGIGPRFADNFRKFDHIATVEDFIVYVRKTFRSPLERKCYLKSRLRNVGTKRTGVNRAAFAYVRKFLMYYRIKVDDLIRVYHKESPCKSIVLPIKQ
jgi:hypothetical protein